MRYSVTFGLPDHVVRAASTTLTCPVVYEGAFVVPSSGTGTVYDANGDSVHSQAVVVVGDVATITVPPSAVPTTKSLESRWRVEWSLVLDGDTYVFSNRAHFIRSEIYPVVGDAQLFARESGLDPNSVSPHNPDVTNYQKYLDAAWETIVSRISSRGPLPFLIMDPTALREVHILLTLSRIFEDYSTRLKSAYSEKAQLYRELYQEEFSSLVFAYDADQDGKEDDRLTTASPHIWLCGRH